MCSKDSEYQTSTSNSLCNTNIVDILIYDIRCAGLHLQKLEDADWVIFTAIQGCSSLLTLTQTAGPGFVALIVDLIYLMQLSDTQTACGSSTEKIQTH